MLDFGSLGQAVPDCGEGPFRGATAGAAASAAGGSVTIRSCMSKSPM